MPDGDVGAHPDVADDGGVGGHEDVPLLAHVQVVQVHDVSRTVQAFAVLLGCVQATRRE